MPHMHIFMLTRQVGNKGKAAQELTGDGISNQGIFEGFFCSFVVEA